MDELFYLNDSVQFHKHEIEQLNMAIHLYTSTSQYCKDQTKFLPITNTSLIDSITTVCHEQV